MCVVSLLSVKMFKRFLQITSVGLSLIALAGCFGFGGNDEVVVQDLPVDQYALHESGAYRINYPIGWQVRTDFSGDIERATEVAFVSNVKEVFFTPVVTVASQPVGSEVTSRDFALNIIEQNKQILVAYNELERTEVATVDGEGVLVRFTGKTEAADSPVEYLQTYHVSADRGYVITGAHDPNGDPLLFERLVDSVRSFVLR